VLTHTATHFIFTHIYTDIYIFIHICTCTYIYIYDIYIYMYIHINTYVYIYICVCAESVMARAGKAFRALDIRLGLLHGS